MNRYGMPKCSLTLFRRNSNDRVTKYQIVAAEDAQGANPAFRSGQPILRSSGYQSLLTKHQLICSMSAKGNCYDNACAESFFHTFKVEAIYGERFATREEMRLTVFEYIEVDHYRIVTGGTAPMGQN